MVLRIEGLSLALEAGEERLMEKAAEVLGIGEAHVTACRVVRRSVDARRNRPPVAVYILDVETSVDVPGPQGIAGGITVKPAPGEHQTASVCVEIRRRMRPVIVGCGPAGLFAALTCVLHDLPVLLLERGKPVHERAADVAAFWHRGIFNPESHVQFGEGGAGAFSDGKLTSRSKNPLSAWIKKILVDMGAPASILTDGKPHIGTDCLRDVLVNLRQYLTARGCDIRFRSRVTDLLISGGQVAGVAVNDREEIPADCLILACGQSGDDTYELLHRRGVALEPKPFAMGLRVEHPQALINTIQYGRWAGHPLLPPAEYFLTARVGMDDRSVYTFCMCPGGQVIGSSAQGGDVITNGMSNSLRDGSYANSAVVVNCRIEDFQEKMISPLGGLIFRRRWEAGAFAQGGGDYRAPAEGLLSFLEDKTSPDVGITTFLPGVRVVSLKSVLPSFAAVSLQAGFRAFERKMPGFITREANLIGVETRTSSPVRITRGSDGQSCGIAGLYPCGEGAGYAGGIISSALDGIRAAQRAISA